MRCEISRTCKEITEEYCRNKGVDIEIVDGESFIELVTIEDIIDLSKKVNCDIIIDDKGVVEIYDDYME